jgi:hypothetical protein
MILESFLFTIAALSGLLFVVASMLEMGLCLSITYNKSHAALEAIVEGIEINGWNEKKNLNLEDRQ